MKHPVTIHANWSVTTPHDLDAERVAAAFGGYTSCLPFVEKTIPALKAVLPVLLRQARAAIQREDQGEWYVLSHAQAARCCRGKRFLTAGAAARHVRSAAHISRAYDVPQWQVSSLMRATKQVWGPWNGELPSTLHLDKLIREEGGASELWEAGLHPDEVLRFADVASAVHEPLPVSYFLGMAYGSADVEWMREVIPRRPDADTAAWLSWLDDPHRIANPDEWGSWLSFGLARSDALVALQAGLRADQVSLIAREIGWSDRIAARNLVAWARVDCYPTAVHFKALCRHGVEHTQPSRGAIDTLVNEAGELGRNGVMVPGRTELAMLLMVFGTRRAVIRALATSVFSYMNLDSPVRTAGRTPQLPVRAERIA